MNHSPLRHKATRNFRTSVFFLLCVVLVLSLAAAPARGAGSEDLVSPQAEGTSSVPEQAPVTVTLTFRMGSFGTKTLTVEKGQYPSGIPEIPQLPGASILGWYDKSGAPVDPAGIPADRDAVYTARWGRQVSDLLNTQDHTAYIKGYSNGMFKPENSVTRAEAAQMLYSLLLDKNVEGKTFTDVPEGKWYSAAVSAVAGLGLVNGYPDGTFLPNKSITRAEFVTMAVNCDTLLEGTSPFTDVPQSFWAAPYIATAAAKGWIGGFEDGSFHPNKNITRAQAVTILNKMLGRNPDPEAGTKEGTRNFYDVFPDYWACGNILEASNDHYYSSNGDSEYWTDYQRVENPVGGSGWVKDGSTLYYLDGASQKFLRGEQTIGGKKYLFNNSTGAAFTGFRMVGSWRRYYKNGQPAEDISGLGVVKGPYFIKVYKNSNYLIIFAKDDKGNYNTPVRAMRVSCGYPTPTGTFYTPDRYRWLSMAGNTWAQWCTQIQGNYLFHSVPCWTQNNADLEVDEYNHLGDTRSLGCIRLNCRDAKWIYDNCQLGTKVTITTSESSGPLAKPAGLQIPSWHSWDPTDPTAYWRCKANGCH